MDDATTMLTIGQLAQRTGLPVRILAGTPGDQRRPQSRGRALQPRVRGRALHQHPVLAQAVIDGNPDQAAALAAEHFSLTESMLRGLHARVMLRAGSPQEPREPQE